MKRAKLTGSIILTVVLTIGASAQEDPVPIQAGKMTQQAAAQADTTDLSTVLMAFGCPWCLVSLADSLKLKTEQTKLLEALGANCQEGEIRMRDKAGILRLEFGRIINREPVDWKLAKKKIAEFYKLKESWLGDQLDCLKAARIALTPEQLKRLESIGLGSAWLDTTRSPAQVR